MTSINDNIYNLIKSNFKYFNNIETINQNLISSENIYSLNNLNSSIKILLIWHYFKLHNKNIIFVLNDDVKAEKCAEDFNVLANENESFHFPDYEILPYEERSPHYIIRAERIRTIANIVENKNEAVYTISYRNVIRNICPANIIKNYIKHFIRDDLYDLEEIKILLSNLGYENSTQIEKVCQFAVRGFIIDIFSPNYNKPLRFEFFGDSLLSIRFFDLTTQRSETLQLDRCVVIPSRDVLLPTNIDNEVLLEKINEYGFYEGIENDISLIYPNKSCFLDFFENDDSVVFFDNFSVDYNFLLNFEEEIRTMYEKKVNDSSRTIANPDRLTISKDELENYFIKKKYQLAFLNTGAMHISKKCALHNYKKITEHEFHTEPSPFFNSDLNIVNEKINALIKDDYKIVIQSENIAQKNRMLELLIENKDKLHFCIGVFNKGFIFHDIKFAVFTDHEIFKRIKHKKINEPFSQNTPVIDYESLKVGDYIVHINHGIGIYEGIKILDVDGKKIDCLSILYADDGKVFVPIWQLKMVDKYVSEEGATPIISKLGSQNWAKTKLNAKKQIELIVNDIVDLYAERKLRKGIQFSHDNMWQDEMENSFIYEDTPDQATATKDIKADMEKEEPMERLICGDVGFGKTEVAIRAAFKAVMNGFQVVVMVPTTLLAEQHYQTFRARLAQFPVRIALLSRFRTKTQLKKDIIDINDGKVDIVIGTHRVLSADVIFNNVGLLIIDEEHRFGVKHKEKIRKLRSNIDTLYMSATPIPRTMNMVLSKLKSMSLIQTSPKSRLPIRTVIIPFDLDVIKDAIQRELDRGGQVFFLHNRINSINIIYRDLKNIMPELKIVIGHGQLPENELEGILNDFVDHKFDVLLATTIIESGIDIPNANTIIINQADKFGLAQLYQIRGRVGRSNKRAYAYLMIGNDITEDARKRLNTLIEYESLGAGYQIAMRDLEIRGAGTLLGVKQSGIITSVGFNFYNKLLDLAVQNIIEKNPKGIWDEEEDKENLRKIEIETDYYFPKDYITDEKLKLQIYRRMTNFYSTSQFDDLKIELKDRFGYLPENVLNVIEFFHFRILAKDLSIKAYVIRGNKMIIDYFPDNLPDKKILSALISFSKIPINFDATKGLQIIFTFPDNVRNDKNYKLNFAKSIIEFLIKTTLPPHS
jgi:transcription-repair coupling factor (superfamily II helicase)